MPSIVSRSGPSSVVMDHEGPLLESLTRRLAECPAEFLEEPRLGKRGRVVVPAVVSDLLVALGSRPLTSKAAEPFAPGDNKKERNRLRVILIACWLLHDPWFRPAAPSGSGIQTQPKQFAEAARQLLAQGLDEAASLTPAGKFVADPDRREELVRLCLQALGLRPAGESAPQAQDRLATLNTAERQRVIKAAREAEARAQKIREAMAKKAAEEAADKWGRE